MKQLVVLSVLAASLVSTKADLTWDWTWTQVASEAPIFNGIPDTGSGTLTTDDGNGLGEYNILGMTGTFTSTINGTDTLNLPLGSSDGTLYYPGPYLDINGVNVPGVRDGYDFFYASEIGLYVVTDGYHVLNGGLGSETGDFTITPEFSPVPEPANWAGLSAGLLGVVYLARLRLGRKG